MHTNVYSSITLNSQKMETTQMSINKLAAKQIVVCSYSEILFSREKEQSSDACHNLGQA